MLNSFIRGLRLGIILQLSIGPVCLFILQTAIARGITEALKAVLAVVLVDAFYILLALYGLGTCLKNYPGIQKKLRYCGAAVLLCFAVTALADVFHPQISTATIMLPQISSFYAAGLLTLRNPLTIIFWLGMLSAQVSQYRLNRQQLLSFTCGCISATFLFLCLLAFLGNSSAPLLSPSLQQLINICIGCLLIFFAYRSATCR